MVQIVRNITDIDEGVLLQNNCGYAPLAGRPESTSECLDRMILFGERALHYVLKEYAAHYHFERIFLNRAQGSALKAWSSAGKD